MATMALVVAVAVPPPAELTGVHGLEIVGDVEYLEAYAA